MTSVLRFVVASRLMSRIGLMSIVVIGGSVPLTIVVISDFVVVLSVSDGNDCGKSR